MDENRLRFFLFDDDDEEPKPVSIAELAALPAGIWSVRRLPALLEKTEEVEKPKVPGRAK